MGSSTGGSFAGEADGVSSKGVGVGNWTSSINSKFERLDDGLVLASGGPPEILDGIGVIVNVGS